VIAHTPRCATGAGKACDCTLGKGHDPMCPWRGAVALNGDPIGCECELIKRVREAQDEVSFINGWRANGKRIASEIESQRIEFGDIWADGVLTIDGQEYRLTKTIAVVINAVRDMDLHIARGSTK
jgi:hypothetical protein